MEPNYLRWSFIAIGLIACLGIVGSLATYYIVALIRRCNRNNFGNSVMQDAQPGPTKLPNLVVQGSDGEAYQPTTTSPITSTQPSFSEFEKYTYPRQEFIHKHGKVLGHDMSSYARHLSVRFPFIIFVLSLVISDILAQIILSKECHEFCASRRPHGTTEKFETFCGENTAGIVPWCQGPCNGICPTVLCPDGVNLQCPEVLSTPAPSSPARPSPHPPSVPSPSDSDSLPQGAPKNALLIFFGVLIALAVVIGLIIVCVYSTSRNRREHNVYPGVPAVLGGSQSMFSVDQSTRTGEYI